MDDYGGYGGGGGEGGHDGGYMMETGGYGMGGGGGGGGADTSPATGHGGKTKSRGGGGASHMNVVPMTIAQMLQLVPSAADEGLCYFVPNRETGRHINISNVRIVGRLLTCSDETSFFRFVMHDGTGRMEATYYTSGDDVGWAAVRATLREHHYMEVTAKLVAKTDSSGTTVSPQVFHMRALHDPNAVVHHFLSAMHMHVALSHGPVQPPPGTGGSGGSGTGTGSFMGTGAFGGGSSSFGRPGAAISSAGVDPALADLAPLARTVFTTMQALIAERGNDEGLGERDIMTRLPRYSADEIHRALEELGVSGIVYDTGDNGWKFTNTN